MESKEIWKDVIGYEGSYKVSNLGRILSFKIDKKGKILKEWNHNQGYTQVQIGKKTIKVHILVASAFLNHITDGTHKVVIDHINDIKSDNRSCNLQLLSHRENCCKNRKSTSKYPGVSWSKLCKKWDARTTINGKQHYLGMYDTEELAYSAYTNKLKETNPS